VTIEVTHNSPHHWVVGKYGTACQEFQVAFVFVKSPHVVLLESKIEISVQEESEKLGKIFWPNPRDVFREMEGSAKFFLGQT
jgi:hypothetical protein